MRIIELDASKWTNVIAFYDDLLGVLEAPSGHGYGVDALIDSIVWGGVNAVEPPYTVRVRNLSAVSAEVRQDLDWFIYFLPEQKEEWRRQNGADLQVFFEIVP